MDISYQYTKMRHNFGRQVMFCEYGPEMCDSITLNPVDQKMYILRNPIHQPTQHTPAYTEHSVNTQRAEYTSTGCNHAEGGWPKDVNVVDPEATQRYRRKIEKDDGYIHCVMSLSEGMDHYVMQNNAVDMYETYYSRMGSLPGVERGGLRTVNVYRDPLGGRPVASVRWQPDGGLSFAVSHEAAGPQAALCYLWDPEHAQAPVLTLQPPCGALDLAYSPRDANVLAGGLASGQVALWDRRAGGLPVRLSPPHAAHRDLVRCILFINSKSGQEFFSSGPDGACRWWDCRDLSACTDEMIIDLVKSANAPQSMATACGVSVLEYESTIPTRFMVGTENGLVVGGNRKGKTSLEKLPSRFEAHLGPVWSLERNPSFLKNFLTVGDWTVRVWSEDCRDSAVLWSPPQRHKVTAAAWSPTRLSLMLVTQTNGVVSAWDLLRRQHAPVLTMAVCREPLLRVSPHDAGSLVACGSQKGNIYMVELSQNLTQSDKNDKTLLTAALQIYENSAAPAQVLEREARRERVLEARLREVRLRLRQADEAAAGAGAGSPAPSLADADAALGDRDLADAAADYFALLRKELAAR